MPPYNINIPSQVKQYANIGAFPATGNDKTIYISQDTNFWYRWDGATYVPVIASASVGFGDLTGSPSDNAALTSALNAKLDVSAYNDRYKGKYTSLAALQLAHPTGTAGDYAQVDTGPGFDVQNYNWDDEEGWILGGDGSGATNTDQLPEGSTNLYFTESRVRATLLTGLSLVSGIPITDLDSILSAIGKLQAQITAIPSATMNFTNKSGNISQWTNDANYARCIAKTTADSSSITGTVTPTMLNAVLIPANTVTPGHMLEIRSMINKTGDIGSLTHRLNINTSPTLTGATQLSQCALNSATDTSVTGRMLIVKSATNTTISNTATAAQALDLLANGPVSALNLDWTIDQYIIDSGQLANAGDTMKSQGIYVLMF